MGKFQAASGKPEPEQQELLVSWLEMAWEAALQQGPLSLTHAGTVQWCLSARGPEQPWVDGTAGGWTTDISHGHQHDAKEPCFSLCFLPIPPPAKVVPSG